LQDKFLKIIKKRKNLTLDAKFLSSINCLKNLYGIAIGFDRLMMLKHAKNDIKDVLYFTYSEVIYKILSEKSTKFLKKIVASLKKLLKSYAL